MALYSVLDDMISRGALHALVSGRFIISNFAVDGFVVVAPDVKLSPGLAIIGPEAFLNSEEPEKYRGYFVDSMEARRRPTSGDWYLVGVKCKCTVACDTVADVLAELNKNSDEFTHQYYQGDVKSFDRGTLMVDLPPDGTPYCSLNLGGLSDGGIVADFAARPKYVKRPSDKDAGPQLVEPEPKARKVRDGAPMDLTLADLGVLRSAASGEITIADAARKVGYPYAKVHYAVTLMKKSPFYRLYKGAKNTKKPRRAKPLPKEERERIVNLVCSGELTIARAAKLSGYAEATIRREVKRVQAMPKDKLDHLYRMLDIRGTDDTTETAKDFGLTDQQMRGFVMAYQTKKRKENGRAK